MTQELYSIHDTLQKTDEKIDELCDSLSFIEDCIKNSIEIATQIGFHVSVDEAVTEAALLKFHTNHERIDTLYGILLDYLYRAKKTIESEVSA